MWPHVNQLTPKTRLHGKLGADPEAKFAENCEHGPCMDDSARKAKRISMAFCILLFPMFGLALLGMLSGVRTTVKYGTGWYIAYAAWLLGLAVCIWGFRHRLRRRFFPNEDATPIKIFGKALAGLMGLGVLALYAVFGGVPILAHYLTSHPGRLMVTVTAKESQYQRSACSPRLKIKEFTFFQNDHLCPSARAFSQIGVGARLRLEGRVSPFGISVDKYYWQKTNTRG
jgi:hypothetical protein